MSFLLFEFEETQPSTFKSQQLFNITLVARDFSFYFLLYQWLSNLFLNFRVCLLFLLLVAALRAPICGLSNFDLIFFLPRILIRMPKRLVLLRLV